MTKAIHKVIYKPDSQSTDEFMVIVNEVEFKKWKEGDTSIPLALVVDSFDIFHSGQGTQGHLGRISKQTMDSVFNTNKEDEAVKIVLEKGTLQTADGIAKGYSSTNDNRGGHNITR